MGAVRRGGWKCRGNARFGAYFRRTARLAFEHRLKHKGTGSKMTSMTAETAKNTGQKSRENTSSGKSPDQNTALDRRYRQIGISAVAAAVRYQGDAKNPAYAPATIKWRDAGEEAA